MAGLKWVRVDTAFPRNHKVMQLVADGHHKAALVYICGLALSGEQGTDGWIARAHLPMIHATPRDADHLVDVGLWIARPGGWTINDWDQYQPSSEDTAKRTAHARAAAETRWARARGHLRAMPGAMPDA